MEAFVKIVNGPPCQIKHQTANRNQLYSSAKQKLNLNTVDWACNFTQLQDTAKSITELEEIWKYAFGKMGASMLSYYNVYAGSVNYVNRSALKFQYGLPAIWNKAYGQKGDFQNHPLISIILEKNVPLRRGDLFEHPPKNNQEAQYIASLRDLNISEGIAFPIFSFGQTYGVFVMGFSPTHPNVSRVEVELLQTCVQKAHSKYLSLAT